MWSNAIYTFYMVVRGGWVSGNLINLEGSEFLTHSNICPCCWQLHRVTALLPNTISLLPCYLTPKCFLLVSNFLNWWIAIAFSEKRSPSVPPLLLNCTMWGRVCWLTSVGHDVIINLCTRLMNTVYTTASVMMNIDHLCIICSDVNTDHCCCDDEYRPPLYFLQFLSFQLSYLKSWIKVFKHSSLSR